MRAVDALRLASNWLQAVEEGVDILSNRLYNNGKIKDKCESAGIYERLTLLEKQFKGASVLPHKLGYLPFAFRQLWSHERLLNVVEQLIGPDIAGDKHLIIIVLLFRQVCYLLN